MTTTASPPASGAAAPASGTPAATQKMVPFGDAPLKDHELPNFLARAASRAYHKALLKAEAPKPTGSPGFKPSRKQAMQVAKMTSLGMKPSEISQILMVEVPLLEFYYAYEMKTAAARTNMSVAKVALEMALSGSDADMTRFWLTHRAGWKATTVVEHNGIDAAADEARSAREKLIGSGEVQRIADNGEAETHPLPDGRGGSSS